MSCIHNHIDCPCTKDCPRHGHCCACITHHKDCAIAADQLPDGSRRPGKLPACLRGFNWENEQK